MVLLLNTQQHCHIPYIHRYRFFYVISSTVENRPVRFIHAQTTFKIWGYGMEKNIWGRKLYL